VALGLARCGVRNATVLGGKRAGRVELVGGRLRRGRLGRAVGRGAIAAFNALLPAAL
jgi:hypothetical protein